MGLFYMQGEDCVQATSKQLIQQDQMHRKQIGKHRMSTEAFPADSTFPNLCSPNAQYSGSTNPHRDVRGLMSLANPGYLNNKGIILTFHVELPSAIQICTQSLPLAKKGKIKASWKKKSYLQFVVNKGS